MKKSKKNRNSQYGSPIETEERQDRLELEGKVEEALPGTLFKVRTTMGTIVLCTLSGRLRINRIRLLLGDRVRIEVSPYDTTKGRVTYRL